MKKSIIFKPIVFNNLNIIHKRKPQTFNTDVFLFKIFVVLL